MHVLCENAPLVAPRRRKGVVSPIQTHFACDAASEVQWVFLGKGKGGTTEGNGNCSDDKRKCYPPIGCGIAEGIAPGVPRRVAIALSVPALAFTLIYLRSTGKQSRRFL